MNQAPLIAQYKEYKILILSEEDEWHQTINPLIQKHGSTRPSERAEISFKDEIFYSDPMYSTTVPSSKLVNIIGQPDGFKLPPDTKNFSQDDTEIDKDSIRKILEFLSELQLGIDLDNLPFNIDTKIFYEKNGYLILNSDAILEFI